MKSRLLSPWSKADTASCRLEGLERRYCLRCWTLLLNSDALVPNKSGRQSQISLNVLFEFDLSNKDFKRARSVASGSERGPLFCDSVDLIGSLAIASL